MSEKSSLSPALCVLLVYLSMLVTTQAQPNNPSTNVTQTTKVTKQLTLIKEFKDAAALDLSDDGKLLILMTQKRSDFARTKHLLEGDLRAVELDSGQEIDRIHWLGIVLNIKFLPHSHQVLYFDSSTLKNEVEAWDVGTGKLRKCSIANNDFKGRFFYFFTSQQAIATFRESPSLPPQTLFLLNFPDCNLKSGGQVDLGESGNSVLWLDPLGSLNERYFAINARTSNDTRIVIWDMMTNKVIKQIIPKFFSWQSGYTPNGKYLFIFGKDFDHKTYVQLYDSERYELVIKKEMPSERGRVAFSPDGKYMAFNYKNIVEKRLGSYVETTVELYDLATWNKAAVGTYPRERLHFDQPVGFAGFTRFSPDSKYLITSSEYARIWRIE